MPVTLTQSAANRVSAHLLSKGAGKGLRLGIKKSGCSGFAYQMDYALQINEDDRVFESHGVKVVVKKEYLQYLEGIEVDYKEDGLTAAFHFSNPNVTDQCGCGESFTVY